MRVQVRCERLLHGERHAGLELHQVRVDPTACILDSLHQAMSPAHTAKADLQLDPSQSGAQWLSGVTLGGLALDMHGTWEAQDVGEDAQVVAPLHTA